MGNQPITILGGGLAGLTLGIGLRQRGVPVTIWEAGRYPRHKVCGEFISGRGQDVLRRLGLLSSLIAAGASKASSALFILEKHCGPLRSVHPPALCLSRFAMDALLAQRFTERGGELKPEQRWRGPLPEGTVRATGRRAQPPQNGWIWFGLKIHARNVPLAADLELHGLANGYVGLCRLPAGETNICGLFRRRASSGTRRQNWQALLRGPPESILHRRLASAEFDPGSFCSVAGLAFQPQQASGLSECCIGDALTMIPPVTGNGMSMALEAAELAIAPLAGYSSGAWSWQQARAAIAQACDARFAQRLTWASRLQKLMFVPGIFTVFGSIALRSERLWRALFTRTR